VCYRVRGGQVEFLLVRTRAGRWTFPKGGVDGDRNRAAAAAREAYEEAGVRGAVERRAFERYLHRKNGFKGQRGALPVAAHLCRVFGQDRPLEGYRDPTWFSPDQAKERVRKARKRKYAAELSRVIDRAVARIARRPR
jgi:8-oxo-dGTP pyrophosphatase MutT (NUDIX family)